MRNFDQAPAGPQRKRRVKTAPVPLRAEQQDLRAAPHQRADRRVQVLIRTDAQQHDVELVALPKAGGLAAVNAGDEAQSVGVFEHAAKDMT
ncbi:hypothetical protein [Jatrophihabitans lederbergiae]|uniref:Uncharacterized protein n=1 Tax=Jatrophihabitans lederbergiae TaxID=3075547 RepID=A0ABU2J624_9ACTN|nr:hypothetical protein [Jatrophihabitans sp. DSM 44399]MDT0260445.1 hypothetical protein [Jatrophihabitans sp. DSM 44399]